MIEEGQKPSVSRAERKKGTVTGDYRHCKVPVGTWEFPQFFFFVVTLCVSSVCCHFLLLLPLLSRHCPFSFLGIFVLFTAQNPTPPLLKQQGDFFLERASLPLLLSIKVLPTAVSAQPITLSVPGISLHQDELRLNQLD